MARGFSQYANLDANLKGSSTQIRFLQSHREAAVDHVLRKPGSCYARPAQSLYAVIRQRFTLVRQRCWREAEIR